MSNYIKKYDVGNIAIDLPYNSHIHELPLLSFNDFRGGVCISLVYNNKNALAEDNSFNVGKGYKLNIQKRIIFENEEPIKLMDSNGKYVLLNRNKNSENSTVYNNVYTFDDESKRILRKKTRLNTQTNSNETYYELENDDLSREEYNSLGYIQFVYDKYDDVYLEYHYENNLLKWVKYASKENYKVSFEYYNNVLTSIAYGGTTTTLVYDEPDLTVIHYSGVTYYITITSTKYTVKARGIEDTGLYYRTKECTYLDHNITLTYNEGATELDRVVYTFPQSVTGECQAYDYVYVTDKKNVQTKMCYSENKLLYSYEIDALETLNNESLFDSGLYLSDVNIYNVPNSSQIVTFSGKVGYNDGARMSKNSSSNEYSLEILNYDTRGGYFILTGWAKTSNINFRNIIINNGGSSPSFTVTPHINSINKWCFFAYQFKIGGNEICVKADSAQLELTDLKLIFKKNEYIDDNKKHHSIFEEGLLIRESNNNEIIELEDARFAVTTDNNTLLPSLTFSDLYRYMRKSMQRVILENDINTKSTELSLNNGKNILTNVSELKVWCEQEENFIDISEYNIAKRSYANENIYTTVFKWYNVSNNYIKVTNYKNETQVSRQYLNQYFDTTMVEKDNTVTTYTKDKGLLTREKVVGLYDTSYIYDFNNNKVTVQDNNKTPLVKTEYYMDPIWGVMYKTKLSDDLSINDTYDDDKTSILEKKFSGLSSNITNLYSYNKGKLTSLNCDTLNYTFDYNKDRLVRVSKFGQGVEESSHLDLESTIYYPNQANAIYSKHYVYDKYNRLKSIDNELENTYNVFSIFNDQTGNLEYEYDNSSSELVMSEDKVVGQKTRYYYSRNKQLTKTEVTDSLNYLQKISDELYTYDSNNRLSNKTFNIYGTENKVVTDNIQYMDSVENTNNEIDNRINTYTYNNGQSVQTKYLYGNYKRLSCKMYLFNNDFVPQNQLSYTLNKITEEKNYIKSGVNNVYTYTYDSFDRISSITSNNKTVSYEYDIYGRLSRENNEFIDKTIIFMYNEIGNIVSIDTYEYTLNTNPTVLCSSKSYTYDSTIKDRLITFNGTTIPYNSLGCPTQYKGYNLTWSKGILKGLSKGTIKTGREGYTYEYNAYGQRVSKTYNKMQGMGTVVPLGDLTHYDKTYVYDSSGRLISENGSYLYHNEGTTNKVIEYLYDNNSIIGMRYTTGTTTNTYYFERNILGDVVGIYDTLGNLKVKYLYDAYGNCTIANETTDISLANINPIRYRGYYFDTETSMYFLSTRYYVPEWGRFISPDDVSYLDPSSINGLNLYSYCGNDPVNYSDGSGHSPEWNWGTFFKGLALVGTAIGAIAVSVATFGLATPLAMTIVAGVTLGAGVLTGINGVATMIEAGTNYNFVRDGLFNEVLSLSDTAYDWYAGITEGVAIVGTAICTIWNITNPIKGFTDHGRQSALTHDGHGVNARAMQNAVRNPLKVVNQTNGGIKHIGKNAVVVLNKAGKVITTYAKSHYGWRMMLALWLGSELF